jgi:propanol-preferring alcohol dehydrogenase
VNARETDPVEALQALGGVDVAVVLAADPAVLEQAHASLRRGGPLVLVSLPRDNVRQLPIFETVLKGISVIGSIVGTRQDLVEVFALHAAGRTRVVVEERPLEAVNDAIEDVLAACVDARVVLWP